MIEAMKLDVTALHDTLRALDKSLGYLNSDLARDPNLREQFRAASIQAFEITYEVAYKMLKRQLEQMTADPAEVDRMTFMQIIRTAAEAGLVIDIARFREYREKRNTTSHTYNAGKAEEIIAVLPRFAADVRALLSELERHNRAEN